MRNSILLLAALLLHLSSSAQQPSYAFQTIFYFENAEGTKDTLIISGTPLYTQEGEFDTSAYRGTIVTASDFDQTFKVVALPWIELGSSSALFGVEMYQGFYPDQYRYFHHDLVTNYDALQGSMAEGVFLLFKCKQQNMPITVRWDHTYFAGLPANKFLRYSHFIPDHTKFSQPDFWPYQNYEITTAQCLQYNGEWTFHLGDDTDYNLPWNKIFGFFPGSTDTLYGMLLNFVPYYDCSTVGTNDPELDDKAQVSLSPNPSSGETQLRSDQTIGAVRVLDSVGRVVFSQSDLNTNTVPLQLSGTPPGVYFVESYRSDGSRQRVLKWVKM